MINWFPSLINLGQMVKAGSCRHWLDDTGKPPMKVLIVL